MKYLYQNFDRSYNAFSSYLSQNVDVAIVIKLKLWDLSPSTKVFPLDIWARYIWFNTTLHLHIHYNRVLCVILLFKGHLERSPPLLSLPLLISSWVLSFAAYSTLLFSHFTPLISWHLSLFLPNLFSSPVVLFIPFLFFFILLSFFVLLPFFVLLFLFPAALP